MEILRPGHKYELDYAWGDAAVGQVIQFIEKEKQPGCTDLVTVIDGTTNEEVLEMLIDRIRYLQSKFPCWENTIVITKLEESLMWLQKRTLDRLNRGVEGKGQE